MREQLLRALAHLPQGLRAYYLKPPLISWGLMFPG